jgi:amino acid transporter
MSTTAADRLPSLSHVRVVSARKLTTLTLVAATFFIVSGGPFGLEELIGNAGYLRSIVVLLIVPVVWSIPTALMVSELSAAIPVDGGYYVWVARALGPFWGFQEAWLSLASSIFDMALYPTVFVLYASRIFPVLQNKIAGVLVGATLVLVCTAWNLSGVRKVGNSAVAMGVILLAPFLAISALVYFFPGRWHAAPSGSSEGTLLTGILVAMWNFMGWDNASTVAGEVENPQRTYVRAMFFASLLVSVSYLIPVGACWLGGVEPSTWSTGAWAEVGTQFGGRWLSLGIVVAGAVFGVGMLNSLTMSYTRVPYAMAIDGWLPQAFAKLNRFGVPWVSVCACAVAWVAALSLGFVKLIELDIAIYGLSLVLEFVALIALRIKEPELQRPFRVPGGTAGTIVIAMGPLALVALAVFDSFHQHITYFGFTLNNLAVSVAVILLGFVQYFFATRRSRQEPSLQNAD